MPLVNSVTIKDMASPVKGLNAGRSATGMSIGRIQYLIQVDGDANAPHFAPDQEPKADGRGYRSVDGHLYYRPQLRVAQRGGSIPGPDVRFLKDADGIVRLFFELEEVRPPGMPDAARPLNVKVEEAALLWKDESGRDNKLVFGQPILAGAGDAQDAGSPGFYIQAGARPGMEEEASIYTAMNRPESRAALRVTLSFGYWTDTIRPADPLPHSKTHTIAGMAGAGLFVKKKRAADASGSTSTHPASSTTSMCAGVLSRPVVLADGRSLDKLKPDTILDILEKARGREKRSDFHTVRLERSIPFIFNKDLDANKPIYAALSGGKGLAVEWMDSEYGFICVAPYPNTIYRLPDEFRLVYRPELGTPYMVANLYTASNGEYRIRVTLGVVPWHDPEKVAGLRDSLRASSSGELVCPGIVIGGYEKATIRFFSAFPEGLNMLSGQEGASISLKDGFQVTFDLSMGFYRFLAQLLTGPIGLAGEVEVTLKAKPAPDGGQTQEIVRRVPMNLNFGDLAGIPVEIQLPQGTVSPDKVSLVNKAQSEVKIGKCITRLLQVDDNSVLPLDVFEAATVSPAFPVSLPAGATIEMCVKPEEDGGEIFWNAVQVEPAGQELNVPAEKMLDRVHELAPDSAVTWNVTATCPLFERTPLPDAYKELYGLKVKVLRQKFAPVVFFLDPAHRSRQQALERTLSDILGDDAQSLTTFKYQVQNVYFDHEGKWGEEKTNDGSDLFVYPNPVDSG